jgi:peptide chain release factor subunit 1
LSQLFGTLSGNTREVVHKFTVDLPKKHGRGGQSALRFSRLREEARRNYVRKVAELAVQHFITADKVNVQGLVLAGSAELKTDLSGSDLFDPRLLAKVVKIVDVSYGGENGFNQAIELAADSLANVKFVQEKRLIQKYFDEIALDTGKYCFGITDTLKALDMGAVETLIVWENLDITRNTLRNAAGEEVVVFSTPADKDREKFMDKATGLEMEQAAEPQPLLEWFAEKYKEFGATLEFVTNKSQEGSQFVKGFGGIGGILRYKVAFEDLGDLDGDDDEFYGSDDDSGEYYDPSHRFCQRSVSVLIQLKTFDNVAWARAPRSAPRAGMAVLRRPGWWRVREAQTVLSGCRVVWKRPI